jgi:hypothetical protein
MRKNRTLESGAEAKIAAMPALGLRSFGSSLLLLELLTSPWARTS